MKQPKLNEVPLGPVMESLLGGKPSINITMSRGQWDGLLQAAYDAGHNLIEVDDDEVPVRAYRKDDVDHDEQDANARLVSAAPALYEACKAAIPCLED